MTRESEKRKRCPREGTMRETNSYTFFESENVPRVTRREMARSDAVGFERMGQ
jgi:hypothetical protein